MPLRVLRVRDDGGIANVVEGHIVGNDAAEIELLDRTVERDHAILGMGLHDTVDLMRFCLSDKVPDGGVVS